MTKIISKVSTPQYRENYEAIDWGDGTITLANGSVITLTGDKTCEPLRSSGHGVLLYQKDGLND